MDFLKKKKFKGFNALGGKHPYFGSGKLKSGEVRNAPRSFKFNWKPKGFLIDENTSMTDEDLAKFPKLRIMNSRKKFKRGTDDKLLIQWVRDTGWILVTKDIRMAIRALMEGAPVMMINEDFKLITLMETKIHPTKEYKELFDYFIKRYEF